MTEVSRIGPNGWCIDQIIKEFQSGNIKGLQCQLLLNDGGYAVIHSQDLSFLERLGLLEAHKVDIVSPVILDSI